jgi:N-acetylmuramoyl-L-alanine amidase
MPITHRVRLGECISSIAFEHGHFPDTVWKAAENNALRESRKNQNTLCEGDLVVVPDKRPQTMDIATEQRHTFRRRGVPEKLRMQFFRGSSPRANEPYMLEVDGTVLSSGQLKTDANGVVEHHIPPGASLAKIRFDKGAEVYEFRLGELSPIDTIQGVQGRLKGLGLFAGEEDGEMSDDLREAIGRFQAEQGLDVTGDTDENTKNKLKAECDG